MSAMGMGGMGGMGMMPGGHGLEAFQGIFPAVSVSLVGMGGMGSGGMGPMRGVPTYHVRQQPLQEGYPFRFRL